MPEKIKISVALSVHRIMSASSGVLEVGSLDTFNGTMQLHLVDHWSAGRFLVSVAAIS